jgi:hypothetical protein
MGRVPAPTEDPDVVPAEPAPDGPEAAPAEPPVDLELAAARSRVTTDPFSPAAHAALASRLFLAAHDMVGAGQPIHALALASEATSERNAVCRLVETVAGPDAERRRCDAALRRASALGFEAGCALDVADTEAARTSALACLEASEALGGCSGDAVVVTGLSLALQRCATLFEGPPRRRALGQSVRWLRSAVETQPTLPRRRLLGTVLVELSTQDHRSGDHAVEQRHRAEAVELLNAAFAEEPAHVATEMMLFWARLLQAESLAESGRGLRAVRLRGRVGLMVPELVKHLRTAGRDNEADAVVTMMRSATRGIPLLPAGAAEPLIGWFLD